MLPPFATIFLKIFKNFCEGEIARPRNSAKIFEKYFSKNSLTSARCPSGALQRPFSCKNKKRPIPCPKSRAPLAAFDAEPPRLQEAKSATMRFWLLSAFGARHSAARSTFWSTGPLLVFARKRPLQGSSGHLPRSQEFFEKFFQKFLLAVAEYSGYFEKIRSAY